MSVCQGCGIAFTPKKSNTNAGRYHSRECAHKHYRRPWTLPADWNDESWWFLPHSCKRCGEVFLSDKKTRWCGCNRVPEYVAGLPKLVQCKECGCDFERTLVNEMRSNRRYCDKCVRNRKRANKKKQRIIRESRKYGHPLVAPELINEESLFCSQLWICGLCGESVPHDAQYGSPLKAEMDHIVPISRNGTHTRNNVQCTHRICNQIKSDMSQDEAKHAIKLMLACYDCHSIYELAKVFGVKVGRAGAGVRPSKIPKSFRP